MRLKVYELKAILLKHLADSKERNEKLKAIRNLKEKMYEYRFKEVLKSTFVKTVITENTAEKEFVKAVDTISKVSNNIPLIIQPASFDNITNQKILKFYSIATIKIKDVRILPQLHKLWKMR